MYVGLNCGVESKVSCGVSGSYKAVTGMGVGRNVSLLPPQIKYTGAK